MRLVPHESSVNSSRAHSRENVHKHKGIIYHSAYVRQSLMGTVTRSAGTVSERRVAELCGYRLIEDEDTGEDELVPATAT
jgi:hypothetical protein